MKLLLENLRVVNALPPVANAFAGTVYPTGINISGIGKLFFIIQKGVGTTGTTTVQVVAGDDGSPLTESAVTFNYQRIASNNTTIGAVTKATTSGFLTTAGSSDTYIIEVDAQALASSGYKYAHLKMVEGTASAVLGGVIALAADLANSPNTADIVS